MAKQYRVVAPCLVHVPVMTATGPALGTVYADNVLPDGVPEDKIRFWLDGGMIEEVKTAEPEPKGPEVAKSQDSGPAKPGEGGGGQNPGPEPVAPPTGGAGSGKEAWVDYAVATGKYDRAVAEGMSRDDLIKALKPAE